MHYIRSFNNGHDRKRRMDSLCSQCGATLGLPRFYAAFVLTRANTSGVQDGSPVNRCGRSAWNKESAFRSRSSAIAAAMAFSLSWSSLSTGAAFGFERSELVNIVDQEK
jgi:hypothetical protein